MGRPFLFKDSDVYKFQLYSSLAYAPNLFPSPGVFPLRIFPAFQKLSKPELLHGGECRVYHVYSYTGRQGRTISGSASALIIVNLRFPSLLLNLS